MPQRCDRLKYVSLNAENQVPQLSLEGGNSKSAKHAPAGNSSNRKHSTRWSTLRDIKETELWGAENALSSKMHVRWHGRGGKGCG